MEQRQCSIGTTARSNPVNNREILFPNGYDRNEEKNKPLVQVRDTAVDDDFDFYGNEGFESNSPSDNVTVTIKIGSGGDGIVTETDKRGLFVREEITYSPVDKGIRKDKERDNLAGMRQQLLGIETLEGQGQQEPDTFTSEGAEASGAEMTIEKETTPTEIESVVSAINKQSTGNNSLVRKQPIDRQNSLYDEYEKFLAPSPNALSKTKELSEQPCEQAKSKPKVTIVRCEEATGRNSVTRVIDPDNRDNGEDFMSYLQELRGDSATSKGDHGNKVSNDSEDFSDYLKKLEIHDVNRTDKVDTSCTAVKQKPLDSSESPGVLVSEPDEIDLTSDASGATPMGAFRISNPIEEDIITISDDNDEDEFFDVSDGPTVNELFIEEITISDEEERQPDLSNFNFNSLTKASRQSRGGNGFLSDSHESEDETPYPGDEIIVTHKAIIKKKGEKSFATASPDNCLNDENTESESDDEDEDDSDTDETKSKLKRKRDDSSDDDDENEASGNEDNDGFEGGEDGNDFGFDENGNGEYDDNAHEEDPDNFDQENNQADHENEGFFSPGLRSRSAQKDTTDDYKDASVVAAIIEPKTELTLKSGIENTDVDIQQMRYENNRNKAEFPVNGNDTSLERSNKLFIKTEQSESQITKHKTKSVTVLKLGDLNSDLMPNLSIASDTIDLALNDEITIHCKETFELSVLLDESDGKKNGSKSPSTDDRIGKGNEHHIIIQSPDSDEYGSLKGATGISPGLKDGIATGKETPFSPEDQEVFEILDITESLNNNNVDCQFQTIDNYEVEEIDSDTEGQTRRSDNFSQSSYDTDPVVDLLSPPEAFKDSVQEADMSFQCQSTDLKLFDTEEGFVAWTSKDILACKLLRCDSSETETHPTMPGHFDCLEKVSLSDFSSSDSRCSSVDYEEEFEKAIERVVHENEANGISNISVERSGFKSDTNVSLRVENGNSPDDLNCKTNNITETNSYLSTQVTLANEELRVNDNKTKKDLCSFQTGTSYTGTDELAAEKKFYNLIELKESRSPSIPYSESLGLALVAENFETDTFSVSLAKPSLEDTISNNSTKGNMEAVLGNNNSSDEIMPLINKTVNVNHKCKENKHENVDADKDIFEDSSERIVSETVTNNLYLSRKSRPFQIEDFVLKWYAQNQQPRLISYFVPYIIEDLPKPTVDFKRLNIIKRVCLLRKLLLNGNKAKIIVSDVEDQFDESKYKNLNVELEELKHKCDMWTYGGNDDEEIPGDIIKLGAGYYIFGTGAKLNLPVGPRLKKTVTEAEHYGRSHYHRG